MPHPGGGPARAQWVCLAVDFSESGGGYSIQSTLGSSNSKEDSAAHSASGFGDVKVS